MDRTRRTTLALAVATALTLALAGCGELPFEPAPEATTNSSGATTLPVLTVASDQTVSYDSIPTGDELYQLYPTSVALLGSTAISVSEKIDGSVGGSLRGGRFILKVPAGAFDGTATVTMTLPDSTVMLCDLTVSPDSLNGFKVPVDLALDTRDLSVDPSTLSIYWYDPSSDRWVDMDAKPDPISGDGTVSLNHFSRYAGGKAGW